MTSKDQIRGTKTLNDSKVPPEPPDHITDCADSDVDPSELLTEAHSVVSTPTPRNIMPGESKVGYSWEDNEGGLSVEDLHRGFISEVHSCEDG